MAAGGFNEDGTEYGIWEVDAGTKSFTLDLVDGRLRLSAQWMLDHGTEIMAIDLDDDAVDRLYVLLGQYQAWPSK